MGFFLKVEYNIFQLFNLFLMKRTIPKGTRILNSVASSVPTAFPSPVSTRAAAVVAIATELEL